MTAYCLDRGSHPLFPWFVWKHRCLVSQFLWQCFVFAQETLSPRAADLCWKLSSWALRIFFCIPAKEGNIIRILQVGNRGWTDRPMFVEIYSRSQSTAQQNRAWAKTYPCFTPDLEWNLSNLWVPQCNLAPESLFRSWISLRRMCRMLMPHGAFHKAALWTESKAAFRSKFAALKGWLNSCTTRCSKSKLGCGELF